MSDDISDIAAFYNTISGKEERRLEERQLEYDLTWRYLDRYLPLKGTILEVGAATGRYTLELARRGYQVTAVDLSPVLLQECRRRIVGAGLEQQVRFAVADARDLGSVAGEEFDAVLLMGPLYHLIVEDDRRAALRAAFERLRPGGLLVSAWLSRFGVMSDLIKNNPGWIEGQAEVHSVLEQGRRPDDFARGGFRAYMSQITEIVPLHEAIGLETLALAGVEPVIGADDESYNRLQGEQRRLWLDLLFAVGRAESILGASRHFALYWQEIAGTRQVTIKPRRRHRSHGPTAALF